MHLDLTGDVGLGRPELARVPQQPAHGVGGAQLDERGVGGAGLRAVPGPQPHRQVTADERPQRLLEPLRDTASVGRAVETPEPSWVAVMPWASRR